LNKTRAVYLSTKIHNGINMTFCPTMLFDVALIAYDGDDNDPSFDAAQDVKYARRAISEDWTSKYGEHIPLGDVSQISAAERRAYRHVISKREQHLISDGEVRREAFFRTRRLFKTLKEEFYAMDLDYRIYPEDPNAHQVMNKIQSRRTAYYCRRDNFYRIEQAFDIMETYEKITLAALRADYPTTLAALRAGYP